MACQKKKSHNVLSLVFSKLSHTVYVFVHTHTQIYMYMYCSVTKLCPSLFDTIDYNPPGSSVHGIVQALAGQNARVGCQTSRLLDSFFRGLLDSRIEPASPALEGGFFTTEPPEKPIYMYRCI